MTHLNRYLPVLFILVLAAGCSQNSEPPNDPEPRDMGARDMVADTAVGDVTLDVDTGQCEPESNDAFCTRLARNCGELTARDICGVERTVDCGSCAPTAECGVETANVCTCTPQSEEEFCADYGAECGQLAAFDACANERQVDCGDCAAPEECVGNICGCDAESDTELCADTGSECGVINVTDACNNPRTVDCGSCVSPETCGGAGTANECGCQPESAVQFCSRLVKNCGVVTAPDNCGVMRSENCGTCTLPAICAGGGTPNTCACATQTDAEFCAANSAECGAVTAMDACGQMRTVDCGACTGSEVCGGGGVANTCGCTPETDVELCTRLGLECDTTTANDNCGTPRTVDCGTCADPDSCNLNVCDCEPNTDADFCILNGAPCGGFSGLDNCGVERVVDCGLCGDENETCRSNRCECTPEPDTTYCEALEAECGMADIMDNCGVEREIHCGTCEVGEACVENECI